MRGTERSEEPNSLGVNVLPGRGPPLLYTNVYVCSNLGAESRRSRGSHVASDWGGCGIDGDPGDLLL